MDPSDETLRRQIVWQPSVLLATIGDDLAKAATTLKKKAASVPDGLHVRHLALLSPPLRDQAAGIMGVFQATGILPTPLRAVRSPLIPKPNRDGKRPIGILPALYRVHAAATKGTVMGAADD